MLSPIPVLFYLLLQIMLDHLIQSFTHLIKKYPAILVKQCVIGICFC